LREERVRLMNVMRDAVVGWCCQMREDVSWAQKEVRFVARSTNCEKWVSEQWKTAAAASDVWSKRRDTHASQQSCVVERGEVGDAEERAALSEESVLERRVDVREKAERVEREEREDRIFVRMEASARSVPSSDSRRAASMESSMMGHESESSEGEEEGSSSEEEGASVLGEKVGNVVSPPSRRSRRAGECV